MDEAHSDQIPEALLMLSFEDLIQGCVPFSQDMIEGLEDLLAGVEYDPEESLLESFVLPRAQD